MAATGKVLGTVTSVVGEAKATAADGTVRVLQVGDVVHSDEVITTNAAGAVNIALESGKTLDCGANTDLSLHESILGVATATAASPAATGVPGTPAAPGTVEALQQAIASGQDPSQIAPATAAGGAPAAGGAGDGSGGTPVIIEQANTASVITSGFPTAGGAITFPAPEFQLLPIQPIQPGTPVVSVSVQVQGEVGVVTVPTNPVVSTNATGIVEGTDGEATRVVNFVIKLDQAFTGDVTVTYQIVSGPANAALNTDAAQAPSDYTGQLTGTITIPAGTTEFIVPVQIVQDHLVENNENFSVVLTGATNATIDPAHGSAIVTIQDDDTAPVAHADTNWAQEDAVNASGNVLEDRNHPGAPSGTFADVRDVDTDAIHVTTPGSFAGIYGTLVLNADGSYTYTVNNSNPAVQALDTGESVKDTFSYTISDGFNTPSSATLAITIFGSNDVPTISVRTGNEGSFGSSAQGTVDEAALATGSNPSSNAEFVTGSFKLADADGPDDIQSVTINGTTVAIGSLAGAVFHGSAGDMTVTSYSNGVANFTYELKHAVTDVPNQTETDVFTLTTSDGTASSAPATVTISILDDVPTAVNDAYQVNEDTVLTVTPAGVLGNDTPGADGNPAGVTGNTSPSHGSLTLNANGSFTYTPAANYNGPDSFTYTIRDADGDTSTATVNITVIPVNDAPVAVDDANAITEDTVSITSNVPGVLGNDIDVDSSILTVTAVRTGTEAGSGTAGTLGSALTGDHGTLTLFADGHYTYTLNNDDPAVNALSTGQSITDTFTYTMSDGSLTDKAQLVITINGVTDADMLVVGSGVDDVSNSTAPYTVGTGPGVITGQGGNDILVGDPGGSTLRPGATANVALVLDISGSMSTSIPFGSTEESRLQALKDATINTLDSLYNSGAANVRVHIDQFSTNSASVGTFNLTTNGVDSLSQLNAAKAAVNALTSGGSTNYEAGLQSAIAWINTSSASGGPLASADVNKLLFISDGEPNYALSGNATSTAVSVSAADAIASILGTLVAHGSVLADTISEVGYIETHPAGQPFTIEAIGINVSASALALLSQVEGTGGLADNIHNAAELSAVVGTLTGAQVIQTSVGGDAINGGLGNDLIFGDALNTDALAAVHGLSTPAGAGWLVFQQLEAHVGTGSASWDRAATIDYIKNHQAELAAESGRTGGNDTIDGGPGNDTIYGQEGSDLISGGTGHDILTGGTGVDTFKFTGPLDAASSDTITDFATGEGGDVLDLHDVLPAAAQGQSTVGALGAYINVQTVGSNTVVSVDADGAGPGAAVPVVTLNGVTGVTLADLLSNSQIHT